MPSEPHVSFSQTQLSPSRQLPTASVTSPTDSLLSHSPHQHGKPKTQKHVVGAGRTHARVLSNKGLHKLAKPHGADGSHTDLKKLARNASSTTLKKNSSHVHLKRNRSSADIPKRSKASNDQGQGTASVHFEIGDQEEAWESSSASPALSRSASRTASNHSSSKPSAAGSQSHSPPQSPAGKNKGSAAFGTNDKQSVRHSADAKVITERLLQRVNSHNTTKMSLATATPSASIYPSDSPEKSQSSTANGTPSVGSGQEFVSRFVGSSGTPSENSPFLQNLKGEGRAKQASDDMKRAQSMGNLTRPDQERDDEEESVLAPRSRKSSTGNAYVPPQQSRTQQKLWLQRASSNIEPQQMAPGGTMNGLAGLHGGLGGTSLVGGAGYDSRDPRIKLQLERTGLQYLVVRRYQDPIGQAIKRLSQLPGAERNRRIPPNAKNSENSGRYGLSQSLKDSRNRGPKVNGANSSYEGQTGSPDEVHISDRGNDNSDQGAVLRGMWDKSYDLSASAD
ncbi:hypothetical protein QTJ16_002562 [Diplocarpon rosae]|uniref:Uncharacterized protein n=1 Tax=Diplocarpon rosae TaxID=946125 RepID=A0AAD9WG30_9HELO|nr:hypothetical protein QTJ16_002562 [Diplocarpon rosae]